mmetsp:Transcript_203/g.529  ORF Transcript_203/g.529 Transcript_203/m.529 type:complete len:209 (-) Transcript_203:1203-1829(-)
MDGNGKWDVSRERPPSHHRFETRDHSIHSSPMASSRACSSGAVSERATCRLRPWAMNASTMSTTKAATTTPMVIPTSDPDELLPRGCSSFSALVCPDCCTTSCWMYLTWPVGWRAIAIATVCAEASSPTGATSQYTRWVTIPVTCVVTLCTASTRSCWPVASLIPAVAYDGSAARRAGSVSRCSPPAHRPRESSGGRMEAMDVVGVPW